MRVRAWKRWRTTAHGLYVRAEIWLAGSICRSPERELLYSGPIRIGRFGEITSELRNVWLCRGCGAARLEAEAIDYVSNDYRDRVAGGGAEGDFYRIHDGEQAEKLARLGTAGLRGAVLLDVGCGAGSLLDLARGYCRATLGVEPSISLREAAAAKGHAMFPDCSQLPAEWRGGVDHAVCFSVIEHVEDPLALLREIHALKPGGRLLLSTPNRLDWMLELLPEYVRFFYRLVHRWYFDAKSLSALVRLAGFDQVEVSHAHRFDVSNAVLSLRDKQPTGLGKLSIPPIADDMLRRLLQATGRADYLYCECKKG